MIDIRTDHKFEKSAKGVAGILMRRKRKPKRKTERTKKGVISRMERRGDGIMQRCQGRMEGRYW